MFNNLIESSSHTKEYKRRGSFLLFTGATYVVLFVVAGVASIYAYDAHLEAQTTELVTLLSPQEIVPERQPEATARPEHSRATNPNEGTVAIRRDPMLDVDRPEIVPTGVSAKPNQNPPLPPSGLWKPGNHDFTPGVGGPGSTGNGSQVAAQPARVVELPDPPPAPTPKPVPPILKVSRVLNSQALLLPRPNYPPLAKNIRLQGSVIVQVLIDETGKVISAKVTSGHPLFVAEAQRAAMQARFSPTLIGDTPVKVSGVITYKFEMNQ